ncbi:hypothetical protein SAMD00019534_045830 [Acytostelium subglobosum LB1]|uniref:hypothetical protein n=1 Tax=Acytostelium subglobosum LB1 TaxID=1410327 RepID=UPI000644A4F3|nr:hypothetical protein SAMD00019534_045830 [Acytostelium subglobosum LB1]GAM21408.1 hypothetical protein SAMD00019534_045830 [Acytostelium subglobosum LB1]|eukprot:XP_012755527.1 hypothetical protein SAMD00019534_045830 [Acytostelium subglobosum LB1]
MVKEKLLVTVTGGKHLKKKKTWILVKFKLHNNKYKTKYVNGGDLVEFQKETFIFEVNEDVYPAGDLEVKAKTWEMFKSGEVFASAVVPLAPITSEIRTNNNSEFTELTDSGASRSSSSGFSSVQRRIQLRPKKGDDNTGELTISFELVPESDTTTMKSIPLLFRWFPDLPHSETVISECYCTKQSRKKTLSMSHNGTLYITQSYLCFRSPSHLAKNKKVLISNMVD